MKRARLLSIALLPAMLFCQSKDDPNYLWLMSLAVPPGTSTESTEVQVDISDVQGSPDFLFNTTQTVGVYITVRDPVGTVPGTLVQVLETTGPSTGEVIFQAAANAEGNVQGSFTVNQTNHEVTLKVTFAGETHSWLINIENVQEIRRFLFVTAQVSPVAAAPDADNDGVPDSEDAYPTDATRSAIVRLPSQGYYTVAYEDLYPTQGDADLNDYVIQVRYEQDLNKDGKIARIRGYVQHVARGAGYRHTLNLNLAGVQGAQMQMKRFTSAGVLESDSTTTVTNFSGVNIMPNSGTTISSPNSSVGETYNPGKKAEFEISLASPVPPSQLGSMPYDLYINVINTGKEIHFPGRNFDAQNKDLYLDPAGFPWATIVPGTFKWPYETKNVHTAYPKFHDWYTSAGQTNTDWYLYPVAGQVFPVP